jgi:predicted RNA-binding protein YlxR (DUF448 family)
MSAFGTSRHFAASQNLFRYWSNSGHLVAIETAKRQGRGVMLPAQSRSVDDRDERSGSKFGAALVP